MKPELIAFSQNLLGGIQSFYFNLLTNDPFGDFDKKWILTKEASVNFAEPPKPFGLGEKIVRFDLKEGRWRAAKKISDQISNRDGIVLTNHVAELDSLLLYPKPNKTIFHLVHDHLYLDISKQYQGIIDGFITHNYQLFEDLKSMFPSRHSDIFYLPYGIQLANLQRQENKNRPLKIAFVARLHKDKGVYDLLTIDDLLLRQGYQVEWLVTGDGPEKEAFLTQIKPRQNFSHLLFTSTEQLYQELKACDIFILPSVLDGTPVAMIESMSVGLVPVVYNFNKGIEKIVTPEIGYILPTGDCEGVASTIISLINDRELLEEKSKKAKESAISNFNVQDRAKDYFSLFKSYRTLRKSARQKPPKMESFFDHPIMSYETSRKVIHFINKYLR